MLNQPGYSVYFCKPHLDFKNCFGYYKQCCDERWGTRVSFNSGFEEGFFEELIFELDIGRVEEVVDVGKKTGKSGTWRVL